jgi:alkanesulfonate monooxygenase SsuD/methylene tetrahydromethanopterin reductase-like flavin-dependent oxidoreductase (luciferase family)
MPDATGPSFGIMTAPQQVSYSDVLRVWREADTIPQIGHAWLFDHLMPIGGDPHGPALEGWTLLAALAAQTQRLRLGLLVTSNRFRPPAMLAKIAATVDVVSGGRLEFGIGAGSRPGHPVARREYEAHGLPFHDSAYAVGSLAEACTVIRRLWTEAEPFDFDGAYLRLTGGVLQPQTRPATLPAGTHRRTLHRDAACGRRARRPVELPRRRHRRRRPPRRTP